MKDPRHDPLLDGKIFVHWEPFVYTILILNIVIVGYILFTSGVLVY